MESEVAHRAGALGYCAPWGPRSSENVALVSPSVAREKPSLVPTSFKLMRVFYLFKPKIRWGGGYTGLSQCASPHLHENGEPRGFSGAVSFSHNKTNCCLEKPSVSLETGSWGLCASLLNLTPTGFRPSPPPP